MLWRRVTAPLGGERHERHEGARHHGGINLSELDGWWVEAYMPEVEWTLGDGQEHVSQAPAARGVS
jgi:hypothetical protein